MDAPTLVCQDEQRRHEVRKSTTSNGLDYLKVSPDKRTLTAYLLQKASAELQQAFAQPQAKKHISIKSWRGTLAVEVVSVQLCHDQNPLVADYLLITVAQPGDLSLYTLRLVELDAEGRPTDKTMPGIDPRYDQLKLRFEARDAVALNGLDYLEVTEEPRTLKIYFLRKASEQLKKAFDPQNPPAGKQIRFEGGRRIAARDLIVKKVYVAVTAPEKDDYLVIELKEPGDFSIYTLSLVKLDGANKPTTEPMEGIDPRYYQLKVNFKENCQSDLDCKPECLCPPEKFDQPEINYLAKDYASFRQLILDRLSQIMPNWKERHVPDLCIALVEILAYAGDHLSYFQDAVATEAYLNTSRQRLSVRRHARLVDYHMHEGCNARMWVHVRTSGDLNLKPAQFYLITRHESLAEDGKILKHEDLRDILPTAYQVFEPLVEKPEPRLLILDDLKTPKRFILGLKNPQDNLSRYIRERLSKERQEALDKYDDAAPPLSELQQALIDDLNRLLQGSGFYEEGRFAGVRFTAETQRLLAEKPTGKDLIRLNRWLLEEAYATEIVWSQRNFLYLYSAHNKICFYTWGDDECCLPRGAVSATLWDIDCEAAANAPRNVLRLRVGDVLIFEEVIGPKTGNPDDKDPAHRHAVRLTRVQHAVDPLTQEPVVEIAWDDKDALPFPLCISAVGPAPECELLRHISVARGNVILADHGRRLKKTLGQVKLKSELAKCACECESEETILEAERFRPHLEDGPLTFSAPLPQNAPASKLLQQDPVAAQPWIKLNCSCLVPGGLQKMAWLSQADLLRSDPDDPHFVVEMDNTGRAHLRFGDGQSGRKPSVGESFKAAYRVGNGAAGNIGMETIAHVVTRDLLAGVHLWPRNPFPATGGVDPEPMAEVKLFAPTAFRKRLERAITPEDYAELAQRHPRVQRAAAMLRWTGSWYAMMVAIDPFGKVQAEAGLLQEIKTYLERFRRIGHDLEVRAAQFVLLDITMEICVLPGHLRGHVKAELLKVFSNKVRPDGTLGFFHSDHWSFGVVVRLSNLYAAAQAVPGVESVNIIKFERLFEGSNHELDNALLPIAPWEIARLDNDPNFPENGRLEFIMRGGR